LITAKIADNISGAKVPFDAEMETGALAVANFIVGTMGGLPATAVLARTKLNIMSGTKGKFSQFLNAFICIIIVVAAFEAFSYMPLAFAACILVLVAAKMAPFPTLIHLWKTDRPQAWLMIIVCVVSVGADPTYGLILGMVVAFVMDADKVALLKTEVHLLPAEPQLGGYHQPSGVSPTERVPLLCKFQPDIRSKICSCDDDDEQTIVPQGKNLNVDENGFVMTTSKTSVACFEPQGALTYMSSDGLVEQMKKLVKLSAVLIALDKTYLVDVDQAENLGKMITLLNSHKVHVVVCGVGGSPGHKCLTLFSWYEQMQKEGLVATDRPEGHRILINLLNKVKVEDDPPVGVSAPNLLQKTGLTHAAITVADQL